MARIWIAMGFAAALLNAHMTQAQQPLQQCAPREAVMEQLSEKYSETRRSFGLAGSSNSLVEMFASEESGSWTITVTMANGVTCLLASGKAYEVITAVTPLQGEEM